MKTFLSPLQFSTWCCAHVHSVAGRDCVWLPLLAWNGWGVNRCVDTGQHWAWFVQVLLFLWLNDGKKISVMSGTRALSVKFLCDLFNSDDHLVPGFQQFNQCGGLRLDLQILSGMGAADVANLDDVMECMTEEELKMHKSQVNFNLYLQANPWLSMYS